MTGISRVAEKIRNAIRSRTAEAGSAASRQGLLAVQLSDRGAKFLAFGTYSKTGTLHATFTAKVENPGPAVAHLLLQLIGDGQEFPFQRAAIWPEPSRQPSRDEVRSETVVTTIAGETVDLNAVPGADMMNEWVEVPPGKHRLWTYLTRRQMYASSEYICIGQVLQGTVSLRDRFLTLTDLRPDGRPLRIAGFPPIRA